MITATRKTSDWHNSVDALEYGDAATFARLGSLGGWWRALRYVAWAATLLAVVQVADGILDGDDPVMRFGIGWGVIVAGFVIFTLGVYLTARLLGVRRPLGGFAYTVALVQVPLLFAQGVGLVFAGLLPSGIALAFSALLILGLLVMQAVLIHGSLYGCLEMAHNWQTFVVVAVGDFMHLIIQVVALVSL